MKSSLASIRENKSRSRSAKVALPDHAKHWQLKPIAAGVICACTMTPPVTAQVLEEVIVTATRRAESVMDVPYNISAFGSDALAGSRIHSLSDLTSMVAGLNNINQGPAARGNNNNFVLRGLNAASTVNSVGIGNQTVAPVSTYIGETPMFFPITIKDIERVEILRGPQGTLYGSGAAGGTIRILPKKPDFDGYYFEGNSSVSFTEDSGEASYNVDGVINIPINDEAAIRISAGYESLGGFIDANGLVARNGNAANSIADRAVAGDVASGFALLPEQKDVNDSEDWFIRASLRWQPTDKVELQLNYHHQDTTQDTQQVTNEGFAGGPIDISSVQVPGSLFQNAYAPIFQYYGFVPYPNGTTTFRANDARDQSSYILEPYERQVDLVNLDAKVDFGFATFTSNTSYYDNESDQTRDITGFAEITPTPGGGSLATFYGYFPRLMLIDRDISDDEAFTQEIRLASNWDDKRWDFVVGAYYQDLESTLDFDQFAPGVGEFRNSAAGSPLFDFFLVPLGFSGAVSQPDDAAFLIDRKYTFEDIAIFGELTFHLTEQWQVTGGIRAFWQEFDNGLTQQFPFCSFACASDFVDPLGTSIISNKESFEDQIFKVNTSYDVNEDLLAYFTWAEGFRRGGANSVSTTGLFGSLPGFESFNPDKATNWEIGVKGTLMEKVNYTLAGFYIQWDDFQFDDFTPAGLAAVFNGNEAESIGLEFEANGQLTDALSFHFGYTFTDAQATKPFTISDLPLGGALLGLPPIDFFSVNEGDALPGVPKHTMTIAIDYLQPLKSNGWMINYHLNGSYRSKADSQFNPQVAAGRTFYELESFSIWDASVTLNADKWSVGVFVNNIGDEDGITGGVPGGAFSARGAGFNVATPRNVGLSFNYRYQ